MTFNVRCPCGDQGQYSWEVRKDLVVDVIKKYRADFVGTQENVSAYLQFMKGQLPDYAYFGRGREANGGGEGTQLFYLKDRWEIVGQDSGTFQMSATPQVWGSVSWSSLPRVTTWGLFRDKRTGRRLYVYNTHWDHQTGRDEFSKLTADVIAARKYPDLPLVIMGDFNRNQTTNPIRYLLGQDVYPDKKPLITLRDTHPAVSKIDHILTWPAAPIADSLPMELVEAKVIADRYTVGSYTNVSPSDHNPTLVEIRIWKENGVAAFGPRPDPGPYALRITASDAAVLLHFDSPPSLHRRRLRIHIPDGRELASFGLLEPKGTLSWVRDPARTRHVQAGPAWFLFSLEERGRTVWSAKRLLPAVASGLP